MHVSTTISRANRGLIVQTVTFCTCERSVCVCS